MSVCYDLNIYKGADFVFKFRLRSDNDYLNPTEVTFKASASSFDRDWETTNYQP